MKKVFSSVIAVVSVLVACQRQEAPVIELETETEIEKETESEGYGNITINAKLDPETKTYIEKTGSVYNPFWNKGDVIGIVAPKNDGTIDWSKRNSFTNSAENGEEGVFSGKLQYDLSAGTYTLHGYYPKDHTLSNSGGGIYKFTVKKDQTITSLTSFDKTADLMIGTPVSLELDAALSSATSSTVDMNFRRALSVLKVIPVDLTTDPAKSLSGLHIESITLESSNTRLAGKVTVDMTGSAADSWENASKIVTVSYGGGDFTINGTNAAFVLVNPVTLPKSSTLTITVVTDNPAYNVSKAVTLSQDLVFGVEKVIPLTIQFTDACVEVVSLAPSISASDLTIESDDTGGTIDFTVSNLVDGGYVVKDITSDELDNSSWGAVSFNSSTGVGSLSFTCDENTDPADPKTATVHLFYTTDGSTELDAIDVTVTQKKALAAGSKTYYYYYTTSLTNTESKYTPSAEPGITFDGTSSNCGVTSFIIEGNTCTKGLKLNSDAYLEFTTSSDVTASITFYYACRKESDNSGARIKITPTSPAGDAVVYGSFNTFGTINSQTVVLSANTTYRIARDNKELALVYAALTETPN